MAKGLTKRDNATLTHIREYGKRQSERYYTPEETVEIWHDVRESKRKRFSRGSLQNEDGRVAVIQSFVDNFKERHQGKYPITEDFYKAKLAGLMDYYNSSPIKAFNHGGYTNQSSPKFDPKLTHLPWTVLSRVPDDYWSDWNQVRAIRWLVTITKRIQDRYPQTKDFNENGLSEILKIHNNAPFEAFEKAGYTDPASCVYDPVLDNAPWCIIEQLPNNYWNGIDNTKGGVDWSLDATGKQIAEISAEDFRAVKLGGLLNAYGGSTIKIIKEAGYDIRAEERAHVPKNFSKDESNAHSAVTKAMEKTGKSAKQITRDDIREAGYRGVLVHYTIDELRRLAKES